jgi:hypothetical protein
VDDWENKKSGAEGYSCCCIPKKGRDISEKRNFWASTFSIFFSGGNTYSLSAAVLVIR